MGAFNQAMPSPGGAPKVRNPLMTFLIPVGTMFGGGFLGGLLAAIDPSLGLIGNLIYFVGLVLFYVFAWGMTSELKNVTQNPDFHPWFLLIPCLNIYFMLIKVPEEVTKAKQMVRSSTPTRSIVFYFFLFHYALASDLNDIAQPR
jgi:hypothetical protein